jgi:peroxiredoxin
MAFRSIMLSLFLITSTLHSFAQLRSTNLMISGTIEGYEEGAKLYLNDVTDGSYRKIDSSVVSHGQFAFRGKTKVKYLRASISNVDYEERVTFWWDGNPVFVSLQKANFRLAKFRGSQLQDQQNILNKMLDSSANTERVEYAFVRTSPASIIAANILSVYRNRWGRDTVLALYNTLSKEVKASYYGRKIWDHLSFNRNIKPGDRFADFSQTDASGKIVQLSDFKGKVVVLEFWGSWCGPCVETNAALVDIYREFKGRGLEIIAVASETGKKQWHAAIRKQKLEWVNVTDFKGSRNRAALMYGVSEYPTNFIIDRQGIIVAKDVYDDALRNLLVKIL